MGTDYDGQAKQYPPPMGGQFPCVDAVSPRQTPRQWIANRWAEENQPSIVEYVNLLCRIVFAATAAAVLCSSFHAFILSNSFCFFFWPALRANNNPFPFHTAFGTERKTKPPRHSGVVQTVQTVQFHPEVNPFTESKLNIRRQVWWW